MKKLLFLVLLKWTLGYTSFTVNLLAFFFFFFLTDNVDMENYADHNTEGLESLYQIDIEENVIMSADSSFHWSCDSHIKSS